MIYITIERDQASQKIVRYVLDGHANFAEHGKDIVCAGVSAVAFGTVNSIEALLGAGLQCKTDQQDGRLEVDVPQLQDPKKDEQLQLLLESMVIMLKSIKESYGKYVSIKTKKTINGKRRYDHA